MTKRITIKTPESNTTEISVSISKDLTLDELLAILDGIVCTYMGWKPKGELQYVEETE